MEIHWASEGTRPRLFRGLFRGHCRERPGARGRGRDARGRGADFFGFGRRIQLRKTRMVELPC